MRLRMHAFVNYKLERTVMKFVLASMCTFGILASKMFAEDVAFDSSKILIECSFSGQDKDEIENPFYVGNTGSSFSMMHSHRFNLAENNYRYISASLGEAFSSVDGYLTMSIGQSDKIVDSSSQTVKSLAKARVKLSSLASEVELTDTSSNITFSCKQREIKTQ